MTKWRTALNPILAAIMLTVAAGGIPAAVPEIIVIQGTLEAPGGGPVTGSHAILVEFYDSPSAGTLLSSTSGFVDLSSVGRFALELTAGPAILEASEAWYAIAIDTDDDGIDSGDLFPDRVPVRSVPFSLLSADSEQLAGLAGDAYSTDEERDTALEDKADKVHGHDDQYWSLGGNVLPVTHEVYLGSLNGLPLVMIADSQVALRLEPGANSPNLIGGHGGNAAGIDVDGGTIGGGGRDLAINQVTADYATVSGGAANVAGGYASGIAAGENNTAGGSYSAVGGGASNAAGNAYATIAGGSSNTVTGSSATVGGGGSNNAAAPYAAVAGGLANSATAAYSVVGGGRGNTVSGDYGTISGGGPSDPANPTLATNLVTDDHGTIGGGGGNTAGVDDGDSTNQPFSTVSGGEGNAARAAYAAIGGGMGNTVDGYAGAVDGGVDNSASGSYSALGGGMTNTASGMYSTVAGGRLNTSSQRSAAVGGGESNTAEKAFATVGGGYSNSAAGNCAALGGGFQNAATGTYSAIPGGFQNYAVGSSSFAAGYRARAEHDGTFVWSDSTGSGFTSTAAHQFLISASAGVGIGTNSPTERLTVQGNEKILADGGLTPRSVYYSYRNLLQKASAVAASGNCAAVVSYATNTLCLFDVSDPDNIGFLGYTTFQLQGPRDVQILGQRVYVASRDNNMLVALDISNASHPEHFGDTTENLANPVAVYVSGKYAYVASSGNDRLVVFDVSGPRFLFKGFVDTNLDGTSDVYVSGNFAYVTSRDNNRLAVFDVSNPESIVARGYASDSLIAPVAVHVREPYAYVLGEDSNNLVIFDVSDPDYVAYVGQISTILTQPRSIFLSGDYAYVAFAGDEATYENCGLAVFDVSDPADIRVVSVDDMTGVQPIAPRPVAVTGNGSHILAAYEASHALAVFDVNHLESPAVTAGNLQAGYLDVTDNARVNNDLNVGGGLHVGPGGAVFEGDIAAMGGDNSYILGNLRVGPVGGIATEEVGPGEYKEIPMWYPTHKLDVDGEARFRASKYMDIIIRSPNAGSDEDCYIDFVDTDQIDVITPTARIGFDKADPVKDETAIYFHTKEETDETMVARVVIDATGNLRPCEDNAYSLGDSWYRWSEVYAANGVIQTSDARLKKNIRDISYGLDEVEGLRPVAFTWRDGSPDEVHYGLVAQEAAEILPEVVHQRDGPEGTLGLNYGELVPVLIRAVQEQQEQIRKQEETIAGLEERLSALEKP